MTGPAKGDQKMLEIKNLHVDLEEEEKTILKGVNLTVEAGKVQSADKAIKQIRRKRETG